MFVRMRGASQCGAQEIFDPARPEGFFAMANGDESLAFFLIRLTPYPGALALSHAV